jgi:TolB-like protein/Tfp pilus assembly protein PilF
MDFKKFLSELKRRNVFKVATAYAITGWLIIQIVTSISEPLSLPSWFDAAIIVFVLIGFPLSLLFAWAFELTPEGLKKTKQVTIEESKTKTTGKKLNKVIITTLVILIGFLVFERFFVHEHKDDSSLVNSLPSIAVLPFADMSPNKDQDYFSDGLSEELLNVLAKINSIKVAGRTSSFKYKGKNDDIRIIGKELGVEHVLEGSVRKSGNKIRITAQLIKVKDGFHMWSETYDENYSADNLFNIQDDISKKILNELKIKLSIKDEENITTHLTSNTEALEAYLKGNKLLTNRKPKEIEKAIIEFKKAITLDNSFAMAYARLATSYGHLFNYGSIKREIAYKHMRDNIDKALLLNNNLGAAYAALGHYYKDRAAQFSEEDRTSYKEAMKKAYSLEPKNPEILMWYGSSLEFDSDERMEMYLKANEIDPLAPIILQNLANTSFARKEYKNAETYAKKNIELNPAYIRSRIFLIEMLTIEPNSKYGEGFIEAYNAFKKYPENLDVLNLLANLSSDLELYKVAEDIGAIVTKLYPENNSYLGIKFMNLLNRKKLDEAQKLIESFLIKSNLQEGSIDRLSLEIFKYMINPFDSNKINEYIKKHHSVYFSDTLQVLDKDLNASIPYVISIIRKGKTEHTETITRLIQLRKAAIEKEFEFNGDITKEKNVVLYDLEELYAVTNDVESYVAIKNEQYFNRKIKSFNFTQFNIDPLYDDIRNNPKVIEILNKIKEDKEIMKAKAVTYLKEEGLWDKYKEVNEK